MRVFNLFKIATKAIILNKTRTLLTMLGIIIGVASVITMLAIGEGSKESIRTTISAMGSNMITIKAGADTRGGVRQAASIMESLTLNDYKAIKKQATLLSYTTPMVNGGGQVINGSNNWPSTIYGVNPDYLKIKVVDLQSGSMFTDAEVKTASKVALIGQTVVDNVFPDGKDPVGQMIRFNNIPFKIIGVLEEKGENTFGQDQDDVVIAPYTTVQKRILAIDHLNQIMASAVSEEKAPNAVLQVTEILRTQHKLTATEEDDFHVRSTEAIESVAENFKVLDTDNSANLNLTELKGLLALLK
ncbi:ABC transporter permease [Polaribacter sp. SA4-12]|uniref:ABC transporter permease n=1 Tax=Polaribacter sp. SA4-12 TaxID=1312072 RepID=UPI001E2C6DEC|nr:ABC transporter permease [Polaribacter sp. SA4-12]